MDPLKMLKESSYTAILLLSTFANIGGLVLSNSLWNANMPGLYFGIRCKSWQLQFVHKWRKATNWFKNWRRRKEQLISSKIGEKKYQILFTGSIYNGSGNGWWTMTEAETNQYSYFKMNSYSPVRVLFFLIDSILPKVYSQ